MRQMLSFSKSTNKIKSKLKTTLAILFATSFLLFFQNFNYHTHEVSYNGGGRSLSSIVNVSPGITNNKIVTIVQNEIAYIDSNIEVDSLIINGQLHCLPNSSPAETYEIKAKTIIVNGVFQCGVANSNFKGNLIISLKDSNLDPVKNASYRGIIVNSGGKLILTGDRLKAKWFRLGQNLRVGDSSVTLEDTARHKWRPDDKIVIAPSSYNYNEAEHFIITSITDQGRTLNLNKAAQFNHLGETYSMRTPKGKDITIDQRAEIANLTRNIVIQPDQPTDELGGHVMVNDGGSAYIDSVEFHRMGQAGVMARYPFHWHMVGNAHGQFIKNSSIHDSFQRCITIHKTNHTLVTNNVCYNFKGHGFFFEDGDEINNTLSYNLGIKAIHPSPNKQLLASDNKDIIASGIEPARFPAVSVFWISHPQNTIIHNVAAGSVGTGFWMSFAPEIRAFDRVTGTYTSTVLAKPLTANTTAFNNNTAHSTQVGITWDGAPNFNDESADMDNPNNPADRKLQSAHYRPATTPVFRNLKVYKNWRTGIYFRGQTAVFDNALVADNGWSLFFAYNQIVRNSIVIGRSRFNGQIEEDYLYRTGRFLQNQAGIVMYDGPFELNNVEFLDFPSSKQTINTTSGLFDVTPSPILRIGGARKFTNIVQGLTFDPEPFYRIHILDKDSWLDAQTMAEIRDRDGSLTGITGGLLVPELNFNSHPNCSKPNKTGKQTYSNFKVCPPDTSRVGLFFHAAIGNKIPFYVIRKDNQKSLNDSQFSDLDLLKVREPRIADIRLQNKVSLLTSGYDYTVVIRPQDVEYTNSNPLRLSLNAESNNRVSPLIQIAGLGSSCRLNGAQQLSTIANLRHFNDDGYYSNNNDFYVKLKTSKRNHLLHPTFSGGFSQDSDSKQSYSLTCDRPVEQKVVGSFAKPTLNSDGTTISVRGWACVYGNNSQIDVHVYAGAPGEAGRTMIAASKANISSEANVSAACASGLSAHRFNINLTQAQKQRAGNKMIYIHGISTVSGPNLTIANSGRYQLP